MAHPTTVHLFLMDGSPTGRIKCSLDNWVGKVFLIPRTELDRSKDRPEMTQTGIYLLFGTNDETGEEQVYVGQARERKNGNGVLGRVIEHKVEEKFGYFTHAVLIIDSENNFGPTEISYMENAFYQQALAAGRVRTVNGNDPSAGNVTEEKKAELDRFIENAKVLIGSLGYRVFDAVDDTKPITRSESESSASSDEPLLYLNASGASGTGRQVPDGFVVYAGSTLRPDMTPSAPKSVQKNRENFADRIDASNELTQDTLFSSPSAASDFLMGASSSGKINWKTANGTSLRDLELQTATDL